MTDEPKRYRGQRGPNKVQKDRMKMVAIRLPQHVVDHYKNSSPAMRAALIDAMDIKQAATEGDYDSFCGVGGRESFFA